jgi:hypothetical protein
MDPVTVVLPSKEHAVQLMAFLDAAPFKGIKAKRMVVEIMEAIEAAVKTEAPGGA